VSDIKGGTQTEGVTEYDAKQNIWNEERRSDRRLYSSPNIIRMIMSRKMRQAGNAA
jgi:hypothetical protein